MVTRHFKTVGKDSLCMDIYTSTTNTYGSVNPLFIYSFGGAWTQGKRTDAKWVSQLVQKGYVAVCIDYRLALKDNTTPIDSVSFGKVYGSAISQAVEDLYDATTYLIHHHDEFGIDTSRVIVSGSSAGATNSIMAEYYLVNADTMALNHLPKGFRYAGVIAFAGGVWKDGTEPPVWAEKPCPFIACHGQNDPLVPYDRTLLPSSHYAAFGPAYYLKQLKDFDVSYYFLSFPHADHFVCALLDLHPKIYLDKIFNMADSIMLRNHIVQTEEIDNREFSILDLFLGK